MSRIGAWPPCKGIHAGPQAGQVTRGSRAAVAIWRSRDAAGGGECLAGGLLAARGAEAEQERHRERGVGPGLLGVAGELADELGQVLGAGVVFEEERDVGSVLRPDAEPVGARAEFAAAAVQVVGGFAFAVPLQEFTAAVLAGVPRQGDEEPRRAGHVSQALGAFEGKPTVRADRRQPSFLVAVFLAEQRGADGAEDVVPRRGAGLKVRPEAAQQAQAHEHRQAVPGGAWRW